MNKTLALFAPFLGFQTPSYSTISNWSYRLGVYLLHQPIPYRDDWIIVLDETIQLSKNKALVILGIPLYPIVDKHVRKYSKPN